MKSIMQPKADPSGLFDIRYAAFLTTVAHLRVRLHRYCTRMTGSTLDGEDIMQEALFEAYRKLDALADPAALRPWLFTIAHNRCIDFLRSRATRRRVETGFAEDETVLPVEPAGRGASRAIERLVVHLPPKERACVLLKDVFDHSLEEIAEFVGSTVGGVKSALNRGRAKLATLPPRRASRSGPDSDPELLRLLHHYVELFNRRDWDGVRALTSADARLQVADCFKGRLSDSPYFVEYDKLPTTWKIAIGEIDGEVVLLALLCHEGGWTPMHPVRVTAEAGRIDAIADYYACPWVMSVADATFLLS
ncbi:sigma-70 family RNA polymerase sigma factor [Mesorhizobium sp. VK24D]|uniref:Sigma-70 family RNA polymerase sigma factor n=1 Tax=Mesorhizobium album TaxID=3072314 RepID=A0ABU4Y180_9HYPH|nr:sigma-70 family RNA polymerase sigma factor [Mesorhizobium sp. VK24D]MDX8479677.1 sigma-70 family RNA polymerase sigma factor [Mesorhizobium sp. VK24D]